MKNLIGLIILMFSQILSAQNNDSLVSETLVVDPNPGKSVEIKEQASIPADSYRLLTSKGVYIVNYIASNFNYPDEALENEISGTIVLLFTVEKDGSVVNVTVERKLCDACDAEAVRVIKSAKYQVYMEKGEPKKVQYRIPVRLALE